MLDLIIYIGGVITTYLIMRHVFKAEKTWSRVIGCFLTSLFSWVGVVLILLVYCLEKLDQLTEKIKKYLKDNQPPNWL